jgi:hypothetical protein
LKLSLNSQQKSDFVILDTLCFKLEETLKEWQQSKTMKSHKEALTALDTACAWMNKGLNLILSQVDEAEAAALNRRKATNEIVLMPKGDFERIRKQQPDIVQVKQEAKPVIHPEEKRNSTLKVKAWDGKENTYSFQGGKLIITNEEGTLTVADIKTMIQELQELADKEAV